MAGVQTSASDLEVGELHKKVNVILNRVADQYLDYMDKGVDPVELVNLRDINTMIAWCEKNGISAKLDIDSSQSTAGNKLKQLREEVQNRKLSFVGEDGKVA